MDSIRTLIRYDLHIDARLQFTSVYRTNATYPYHGSGSVLDSEVDIKNVYDFRKEEGFPKTYFVYDTQEKEFSRYIIYNGDYTSKNEFYMVMLTPINAQGESWATLNAFDLCRDYQKGKLKGKLKEVAATLEEDDNRVVVLVRPKK